MKAPKSTFWLYERLEAFPDFIQKKMFGCEAAYLGSRLYFAFAEGDEPWNGLLVATDRAHHAALRAQFSALTPHPVLGKWLYVSQSNPEFEETALALVNAVRRSKPIAELLGVVGKAKKAKKSATVRSPSRRLRRR